MPAQGYNKYATSQNNFQMGNNMYSRTNLRRLFASAVSLSALGGMVFAAGCGGSKALIGKWNVTSVAGKTFSGAQKNPKAALDLQEGGRYSIAAAEQAGTWSTADKTVTIHPEKIRGKTKSEFLVDVAKKYTMTDQKTAAVGRMYADWKMTLSPDSKTLTLSSSGVDVVYQK